MRLRARAYASEVIRAEAVATEIEQCHSALAMDDADDRLTMARYIASLLSRHQPRRPTSKLRTQPTRRPKPSA